MFNFFFSFSSLFQDSIFPCQKWFLKSSLKHRMVLKILFSDFACFKSLGFNPLSFSHHHQKSFRVGKHSEVSKGRIQSFFLVSFIANLRHWQTNEGNSQINRPFITREAGVKSFHVSLVIPSSREKKPNVLDVSRRKLAFPCREKEIYLFKCIHTPSLLKHIQITSSVFLLNSQHISELRELKTARLTML